MRHRVGTKNPFFVSNTLINARATTTVVSVSYIFPLFLYNNSNNNDVFNNNKKHEKIPNINTEFYDKITAVFGSKLIPEEIFYYIYGVLYSNIYREKYSEFLKIDFPRVPFTKDHGLFLKMGELGNELVDLHLLKSKRLDNPVSKP